MRANFLKFFVLLEGRRTASFLKLLECASATVRAKLEASNPELLLMFVANRSLKPDDITRAFERYKKLIQETARNIVNFYERRMTLRAKADAKNKGARASEGSADDAAEDDIVVVSSPSVASI